MYTYNKNTFNIFALSEDLYISKNKNDQSTTDLPGGYLEDLPLG